MGPGLGAIYGKLLTGERVIRDFVTVGAGDRLREKVYLAADGQRWDVTGRQWLLGLDPRVIGIWATEDLAGRLSYTLHVRDGEEEELGVMTLEYTGRIVEENGTLYLLRARSTVVHHIESWRAWLLYRKFYRKPGVSYERLKAVAAAYTYPRRVRVISFRFGSDNHYIFPMDLLADIRDAGRYLLGMRHSNQVLKRIMEVGQIVVAEAPAEYKQAIYQLGRNHSASPPPPDQLPFGVVATRQWGYYLPEWVESYKEVRIGKTQDLGSHMLLCGEWDEEVVLKPETPRLHHIHFLYFLKGRGRGMGYPVVS
ncbi:MAG TPA: hypothetical protein VL978_07485 [Puia sp.]|nr:hypothetical protein [Puia sp.]